MLHPGLLGEPPGEEEARDRQEDADDGPVDDRSVQRVDAELPGRTEQAPTSESTSSDVARCEKLEGKPHQMIEAEYMVPT